MIKAINIETRKQFNDMIRKMKGQIDYPNVYTEEEIEKYFIKAERNRVKKIIEDIEHRSFHNHEWVFKELKKELGLEE